MEGDIPLECLISHRLPAPEFAEAFEISEYGSMPSKDELTKLFPFF